MDDSRRCTAKSKRSGERCKRAAIVGGTVCNIHGGKAKQVKQKAEHRADVERATKAVVVYGLPREVDPHTALLEELHRTAGHVAWLEEIVGAGKMTKSQSPTGKERAVRLDQRVFGGGDQPSVWVELLQRERKHLLDVAKTCISVGIEERRVRLAEQQGALLAQAIKGILMDLGVADRPEVPDVVRRHLTLVSGAA